MWKKLQKVIHLWKKSHIKWENNKEKSQTCEKGTKSDKLEKKVRKKWQTSEKEVTKL